MRRSGPSRMAGARKTTRFGWSFLAPQVFMAVLLMSGTAGGAGRELADILKVSPPEQVFRCATVERIKEFVVTNLSKRTVTISATSLQTWAVISPSSQAEVAPMRSALFTVEVDCKALGVNKPAKGVVLFEAGNGRQKAYLRVNSPLSPLTPK